MSRIYEEFLAELDQIHRRAKGNSKKELNKLLLMALEREELVTHAYRANLIQERLDKMALPENVSRIIRHALLWIWADEDMHVIYTRGALMKTGNWWLRTQAFMSQATGAIGGWSASVVQHVPFKRAPFSWFWARVVRRIGLFTGKVPKEVRQHLRYSAFRDFCRFNIEAEHTAEICWDRIVALAEKSPFFKPKQIEDLKRVVFDEGRHAAVFQIFADALDENDQLRPGVTAKILEDKIREVSVYFLPRDLRGIDPEIAPLGSGGKVWVKKEATESRLEADKVASFQQLLESADLAERLKKQCTKQGKTASELKIVIKVGFMMGYHSKDPSPLADPQVLELLAKWLHENGYKEVVVLDAENIYDNFFQHRNVHAVAEYFGFQSPFYTVVNASKNQVQHNYSRGMGSYSISRHWKEADFRISFGKLRSHPTEHVMLSIANLEWLGSRCEEFIFIDRQADRRTTTMMILDEFPPHYALIDGYLNCPDGLVGIMGCRNPKHPGRFYAGADALTLDRMIARHLGLKALPLGSTLAAADHWFGGWAEAPEIIGPDTEIPEWRTPSNNRMWSLLSLLSFPVYVFLSKRGSLFVSEIDEEAFPPIKPPGFWTRNLRKINRRIIGLNFPKK